MEKYYWALGVVYYILAGTIMGECMLGYEGDKDKKLAIGLFWPVAVAYYLIIRAFIGVYKIIDDALK